MTQIKISVSTKERGDWQVIFKDADGDDYCRETFPKSYSLIQVGKRTEEILKNNHPVTSAEITRDPK